MKIVKIIFSIFIIFILTDLASSRPLWINNITINEYNITWSYTENFSDSDSMIYKTGIDSTFGDNDSFISAWELLKADKDIRKTFRTSIENELDIKINNETTGIELIDVDSTLSQSTIGKTHRTDTISNSYNVSYRLKDSIYNASSIWFLGEPNSPVTIVIPVGIDVKEVTGMNNSSINFVNNIVNNIENNTRNNTGIKTEITGYFKQLSHDRGEISLSLEKNVSFVPEAPGIIANNTSIMIDENISNTFSGISSKDMRYSIVGIGIILIILIFVFKVRKNQ